MGIEGKPQKNSQLENQDSREVQTKLPHEVLSFDVLKQLHEPEEIISLILERHGLDESALFLKTANSGTSMDIFDKNYLLKFVLMRLECVDYKTIADFFNYEVHRTKEYNVLQTMWAGANTYFTPQLKQKIKSNFESIDFAYTRHLSDPHVHESTNKILDRVGIRTFSELFVRTLTFSERGSSQDKFSFPEIIEAFKLRIVDMLEFNVTFERMHKVDTQKNRRKLMRTWSYYFSQKCLDVLPQNIAKISNGFREKS